MQATLTLSLTIVDGLGIVTTNLPPGEVGAPYSVQCNAMGGSGVYTWGASGLPPGLTMSPAGLISGTPTAAVSNAQVTIVVNDGI